MRDRAARGDREGYNKLGQEAESATRGSKWEEMVMPVGENPLRIFPCRWPLVRLPAILLM